MPWEITYKIPQTYTYLIGISHNGANLGAILSRMNKYIIRENHK
jgi:hypothetical protein